jgi:hypothetical protein
MYFQGSHILVLKIGCHRDEMGKGKHASFKVNFPHPNKFLQSVGTEYKFVRFGKKNLDCQWVFGDKANEQVMNYSPPAEAST